MNASWRIPRNNRPNPVKARGRSLLLLGTAGLAAIGTTTLSALGSGNAGSLGGILKILLLGAPVLINAMIFVFALRIATARPLR
jgi:membrane protein